MWLCAQWGRDKPSLAWPITVGMTHRSRWLPATSSIWSGFAVRESRVGIRNDYIWETLQRSPSRLKFRAWKNFPCFLPWQVQPGLCCWKFFANLTRLHPKATSFQLIFLSSLKFSSPLAPRFVSPSRPLFLYRVVFSSFLYFSVYVLSLDSLFPSLWIPQCA